MLLLYIDKSFFKKKKFVERRKKKEESKVKTRRQDKLFYYWAMCNVVLIYIKYNYSKMESVVVNQF